MLQKSFIDTVEALKELGFKPDDSFFSDNGEGLSYDFGNLILTARQVRNESFVRIISVSGIYSTERFIREISIQIPLQIASIEQCAAFIAWGIDSPIHRDFVPLVPTHWIEEGRENFDTLPWVKEQKLYDARPQCVVDRDWLKLALRDLRLLLMKLEETDLLSLTYQNEIFSIRSRLKLIVLPATGDNWKSSYEITAKNFRNFPKRFNGEKIGISVWQDYFSLANWRYPIDKTTDAET